MKKYFSFITFLFLTFLVAGALQTSCLPTPYPPGAELAGPKISPVEKAQPSLSNWEQKWEATIAGAKNEGRVVLLTTLSGEGRLDVSRGFTNRYGIDVEATSAKGGELAAKLSSERRGGIFYADVYVGGGNTVFSSFKPGDILDPLPPTLLLPEVIDPKVWWKGDLDWLDRDKTSVALIIYPSRPIAINTDIIKREEIKSYRDLLNPRWKGMISLQDPTKEAGLNLVGAVGQKIMGLDFIRELAKMEPVIIRDERLQIDWLARGKYPIALIPNTPTMTEFRKIGAPIISFIPQEGSYVTSGAGNIALIKQAPHPNAARLFINWLLSKEGGFILSKSRKNQSGRIDVPRDHLEPEDIVETSMKYVIAYSEEYHSKLGEHLKIAQDIFGPLMK